MGSSLAERTKIADEVVLIAFLEFGIVRGRDSKSRQKGLLENVLDGQTHLSDCDLPIAVPI